ncbi:MAG: response regulator transcription factor [Planctomycetota bacterium]|jgi:DNA-binding response OmpR family regulator
MRVMIADDDPTYLTLLESLLAEWDFQTVLARDGAEALAIMARPDAPSLLLLDWQMPEVDGFEVTKSVRNRSRNSEPYILIVTSDDDRNNLMRIMVAGADDYLIKPFNPIDLKIRLRAAVRIANLRERVAQLQHQVDQFAPGAA